MPGYPLKSSNELVSPAPEAEHDARRSWLQRQMTRPWIVPTLSTLVVNGVILHEIPKISLREKEAVDSGPCLSEVPSA